ncbi:MULTISPECIES: EAL domain-containing protein [unclassified Salmonella]|uniref:EAL domain-containing protein n=1 Tax=unclassified Salmonella TaxID=2614656 RepID=UPI0012851A62|nr:EAL domain-containing protein [Salmonella sp. 32020501-2019-00050]EBM0757538.1 EAL domain-containing protein [Salmonella enterica subsp. enterica serovar Muenchen]ECD1914935.1 EAL domain-containing protein [Salmonella enterica subsp. enterica serovar Bovismorbificans]ECH8729948.1 EAL domain-containing protein [Salmonella enterica subsp. enterica]EDN8389124.1 EAL domain-containing protein [Salmonella enterica subsp. enterica serovar Wandsworth]EDW6595220.1 EAL domain-containing protein [Salm
MKLTAPLVVLCLSGVLVLSVLLMQRQAQQDTDLAVAVATRSITGMLGEAERVMTLNRAFLGQGCTPQLVRQMARSAALSPHLRGVRLLQNNATVCASLGGAPDLPSLPDAAREGPVALLTRGDVLTPSEPVLILAQQYPEGGVVVSLNGLFLRQVLRATADRPGLVFRAGGMEVDTSGVVRRSRNPDCSSVSGSYAFSLATDPHHPVRGRNLLREALPWLLLSLLAATGVTALLRWWVHRQVSEDVQLRRAMEAGEIRPWYQPVVDSRTGQLAGCEVLARWHSPRRGVIPPNHFIPQSERSGMIVPLTRSLLKQVARELGPLGRELPAGFHLAFNLSAAHAGDTSLLLTCRMLQAALPGVILVAEITERERYEPSLRLPELLPALRAAGVRVALDDFGTGYAGLSALDQLPVDYIKLDRSFTTQIRESTPADTRLLMAEMVTEMAHKMKLEVVAEGVETDCQRDWLAAHGVSWLQGYLFSRPLPLTEFTRYLRQPAPGSADEEKGPE